MNVRGNRSTLSGWLNKNKLADKIIIQVDYLWGARGGDPVDLVDLHARRGARHGGTLYNNRLENMYVCPHTFGSHTQFLLF